MPVTSLLMKGGRFESEILATGMVSLTAVARVDVGGGTIEEWDIAIRVVHNGPEVPPAVDAIVREVADYNPPEPKR